jgi:hypothetical protein
VATKQLQVLQAVKALVSQALPGATIVGFDQDADKPTRIGPNGCAVGHPGEPGEPDVDLSPLAYNYSHRIPVEIIGPDGKGGSDLDVLLGAVADGAPPTHSWAASATGSASARPTSTTAAATASRRPTGRRFGWSLNIQPTTRCADARHILQRRIRR